MAQEKYHEMLINQYDREDQAIAGTFQISLMSAINTLYWCFYRLFCAIMQRYVFHI